MNVYRDTANWVAARLHPATLDQRANCTSLLHAPYLPRGSAHGRERDFTEDRREPAGPLTTSIGVALACCLAAPVPGAYAQTQIKFTTAPTESWNWGGDWKGFQTSGELIGAINDHQNQMFQACVTQGSGSSTWSCTKLVVTGIRFQPLFPQMVNGDYVRFGVNAYTQWQGSTGPQSPFSFQRDASDYHMIDRALSCPKNSPYGAVSTSVGPNETRLTCEKTEAPPRQCEAGNMFNGSSGPGRPQIGAAAPGGVGNPIGIFDGGKTERHVDYAAAGGALSYVRVYRGQAFGWKIPGDMEVVDTASTPIVDIGFNESLTGYRYVYPNPSRVSFDRSASFPVLRATPHGELYRLNANGSATPHAVGADGQVGMLADGERAVAVSPATAEGAVWRWYGANNWVDEYGADGRPRRRYSATGQSLSFTYSNGVLVQLTDHRGRQIQVVPDSAGMPAQITLPDGSTIAYLYDGGRLLRVTYADGSFREFAYAEATHVANASQKLALTGATDENGVRIGTYKYDSTGRAVSSEGANGVNKYVLGFYSSYSQVTPPVGSPYIVQFSTVNGSTAVSSRSQPAGSGCAASSTSMTYDGNGNVASSNDFNGKRTCYANDTSRSLETVRVEGLAGGASCSTVTAANATLPSGSRKISSQWHPDWLLRVKVAEPGRFVTHVYNGQPDPFNGNAVANCAPAGAVLPDGRPIAVLCREVEQATTDPSGTLGFNAAPDPSAPVRVSEWTYNEFGQALTYDGPRTDVSDVSSYAYYGDTSFAGTGVSARGHTAGDLQSVTNAAGQVTQFTLYDKHGQLLESVDPNGVVTTNTYDLRQRLLSTAVGEQSTGYTYDAAGQLKRVTKPDGSYIGFDYDPAHRQTAVFDNLGNRIDYTLDNAGNRTAESVKDTSGALRRQLARSIDAIGRVQQVAGRR